MPHPNAHTYSPPLLHNLCVNGDAYPCLLNVPDESIHLTFTSPPYFNAMPYSQYSSYDQYLTTMGGVFGQVYRVTHPGRYLVVNISPVIEPRPNRAGQSRCRAVPFDLHHVIQELGWEFADDIVWQKPAGAAKNRVATFEKKWLPP